MNTISFENQVVIITGAGGGIGRAYALDIARRGGAVVVNDLGGNIEGRQGSMTMADSVVAEITASGGRAIANYDSVVTPEGAERIVAAAMDTYGRVDALINNAGNMINGRFEQSSLPDLDAQLDVHLRGTYNVTRAAWPRMKSRGYGRIVFTSSSAGMFGHELQCGYAAAKAGITGLMNVLSHEGYEHGILCNAVMPNAMSRMAEAMQVSMRQTHSEQRLAETMAHMVNIGNSMDPAFNTGIAVYLASQACSSTHALYSSCGGRIGRVYIAVTEGWQGSREHPASADDVAAHFHQISSLPGGVLVPSTPGEEFKIVLGNTSAVELTTAG